MLKSNVGGSSSFENFSFLPVVGFSKPSSSLKRNITGYGVAVIFSTTTSWKEVEKLNLKVDY